MNDSNTFFDINNTRLDSLSYINNIFSDCWLLYLQYLPTDEQIVHKSTALD